jgi:purine-binding chemotaxis protein CheW
MSVAENSGTAQFLTFTLGQDVFAIDVTLAREVLDLCAVTRVPQAPDYMLGVINLRGSVVPVIDMRRKFGMPEAESTRDTCIVVVDVEVDGDSVIVGALVDSVREVLDLTPEQIEPPPRMGTQLKTELILGMGSLGDRFVVLLDIDRVFSADELALAQGLAETEKAV